MKTKTKLKRKNNWKTKTKTKNKNKSKRKSHCRPPRVVFTDIGHALPLSAKHCKHKLYGIPPGTRFLTCDELEISGQCYGIIFKQL